ncbi:glutaminyl-peptide cyclotransferase [Sphingobacterium sp. lm-10]|uniref:glutaminyl-peptide cyclotransferase n=1 Tax=Sphingobacterium sp. lm-10 TaxID=2944904 RepID=UPI0020214327|nr:glutaminyl-peptide cyclotransferase [Sphingobacterium sp. lm-10]MCL7988685.1 glutaminyl-peptide cyclotransferase [Sphingobacterium sp. lm-10]
MKYQAFAVLLSACLFLVGCKSQKGKFEFVAPEAGTSLLKGEKVQLALRFPDETLDSVVYSVDGDLLARKTDTAAIEFDTDKFNYGNRSLSAKIYYAGKEDIAYTNILIVPPPATAYQFEVINTFPHDSNAFTQGLQYENGVLYESTGMQGRSSLRKVDLKTGNVIQKVDLEDELFGEGMTIMGDKIVLLTWMNGVGFVYDKSNLRKLQTFNYANPQQEGWGITYDGTRLIKTDGSAFLYFMDPVTFREQGSLEVFDDHGPVSNLNELEYVDGKIYANLYYADRDEVVIINPETGVVEGKINFVGLYDGKRQSTGNEMNGIAYNASTKNFYVTGKDWTKLFEVRLSPR